ncbi:MAG: hydrogenase, partial [Planctomycetota bacterium]
QRYDWPGNVRELQHVLERALITSKLGRLRFNLATAPADPPRDSFDGLPEESDAQARVWTAGELRKLEAENIRRALKLTRGKVSGPGGAAERLEMKPTTLASRIKSLGINGP